MRSNSLRNLTITAFLIALGTIMPIVMPKVVIGPISFTLASHVPIFIAMFFSPSMAITVALGTAFGFFTAGFPIIIVFRALTHVIFAYLGAFYLQKFPQTVLYTGKFQIFNLWIGLIHAILEALAIAVFYLGYNVTGATFDEQALVTIILIMVIGGLIHSMVDNTLAYWIAQQLARYGDVPVFTRAKQKKNN